MRAVGHSEYWKLTGGPSDGLCLDFDAMYQSDTSSGPRGAAVVLAVR
jgi:hypothetical protein